MIPAPALVPAEQDKGRGPPSLSRNATGIGREFVLYVFDSRSGPPVCAVNRLVGLVVKAFASRAEDPGLESCLQWDFSGVESYQ